MAYTTHHGKRVSWPHKRMLAAYERKYNRLIYINQGARTLSEQAAFYAHYLRYGYPLAAKPWGGAPHIKWGQQHHALDVNAPEPVHSLAQFYRDHGVPVAFNVRGEAWHMDTLDRKKLILASERIVDDYPPSLKLGDRGIWVKRLKALMWAKGLRKFERTTGVFGAGTKAAIIRFQKKHGLKADGVVGAKTWQELKK